MYQSLGFPNRNSVCIKGNLYISTRADKSFVFDLVSSMLVQLANTNFTLQHIIMRGGGSLFEVILKFANILYIHLTQKFWMRAESQKLMGSVIYTVCYLIIYL